MPSTTATAFFTTSSPQRTLTRPTGFKNTIPPTRKESVPSSSSPVYFYFHLQGRSAAYSNISLLDKKFRTLASHRLSGVVAGAPAFVCFIKLSSTLLQSTRYDLLVSRVHRRSFDLVLIAILPHTHTHTHSSAEANQIDSAFHMSSTLPVQHSKDGGRAICRVEGQSLDRSRSGALLGFQKAIGRTSLLSFRRSRSAEVTGVVSWILNICHI